MLDALREFYETSYANVHRGVYTLSERATEAYEGAREKARAFVNAPSARELIFTRSATESINLVAYAWGLDNLGPGDVVLVTELEHHSNFVPWQYIAKRTGADVPDAPDRRQRRARSSTRSTSSRRRDVKVVATNLVSNSLGTVNPVERAGRLGARAGAIMVVDAAQGAPHHRVDVQALGCDFLAFSSHKLCGPSGVGALWGRAELLEADGAVQSRRPHDPLGPVSRRRPGATCPTSSRRAPCRSPRRSASARRWTTSARSGSRRSREYESELVGLCARTSCRGRRDQTYGPPPERRAGIVSFNVEGIHPHDVAQVLDSEGVAIRAGHHCCQPLMQRLGVAATNRASFYLYTLPEEIDRLVEGLHKDTEDPGLAMVDDLYREVILDHYKNPRGHGVIEDADAHAEGLNPLCGDEVTIYVQFEEDGETIDEVKFSGRGCAISQASTSMLMEMVKGRKATEIAGLPKEELLEEIGIPLTPIRLKCALLGLGVLKVALHRAKGTPLPDEWAGLDELDLK